MKPTVHKPKILVVDDDKATQYLIGEILLRDNVTIIKSKSSVDALNFFRAHHNEISLVILDIILPDCNGVELLQVLRRINPNIPAIAISAIHPVELVNKCRSGGFDGYISKPFEIKEITLTVERYLKIT